MQAILSPQAMPRDLRSHGASERAVNLRGKWCVTCCYRHLLALRAFAADTKFKVGVISDEISQNFDRACYVIAKGSMRRSLLLRGGGLRELSARWWFASPLKRGERASGRVATVWLGPGTPMNTNRSPC
jgi:hypothetical protein